MAPRGPQPGDIVGEQYRLESMIGTGGMGAVWSASQLGTEDDRVAVKFLHTQMANDPLIVQRFLLEARAGIDVQHPNVVRVITQGWLDASEPGNDPSPWLAMELLNGKSLADTLRMRGRIDAVDALAIVADITAGVAAAHDKSIVHRDIKPANVFLQQTEEGVVPKLLDFGISKYVEPGMDGGLTSTGAIVGSAMYMSPEQAAGGYNVDKRSDVWSLGVMLYRMLTGESPLPASGQQEIMVLLGSPKELDLSALSHSRIPPGAAGVVKRCLRKKREERYPSARELEPEIRALLAAQIKASHTPNIDSLLRPASSRATFIAAPLDATPEPTMQTAPTGRGNVVEPLSHEPPTMQAAEGAFDPSLHEVSIVPVVTPANSAPPPSFVGPPTPRAQLPKGATMRMLEAPPPLPPARWEPARSGSSVLAKIGALVLGLGVAGLGVFAYRHNRMVPPQPPAPIVEPVAAASTASTASAASGAVSSPAATDTAEREVEIVEVPTPGKSASAATTATTRPRTGIGHPPPPKKQPKPATSVDSTRHPDF